MSIAELKLQIINKISLIQDQLILEDVLNFLKTEDHILKDLTPMENSAIDEALKDLQHQRTHSDSEAEELFRKWLKK
jgi:hypothetical protein